MADRFMDWYRGKCHSMGILAILITHLEFRIPNFIFKVYCSNFPIFQVIAVYVQSVGILYPACVIAVLFQSINVR